MNLHVCSCKSSVISALEIFYVDDDDDDNDDTTTLSVYVRHDKAYKHPYDSFRKKTSQ